MTLIKQEDAIETVHRYFAEELNNEPYETDEDGDEVFTDMKSVNKLLAHNKAVSKAIKALPSAETDLINKIVLHICYRCGEDEYMRGIKHDCDDCILSEVIDEIKYINDRPHREDDES